MTSLAEGNFHDGMSAFHALLEHPGFTAHLGAAICRGGADRAVSALIREFHLDTRGQEDARAIMSPSRMLGIPEIAVCFSVSDEEREALGDIPFPMEKLHACRDTHVLVADTGVSLVRIYAQCARWFRQQDWPWVDEDFANQREKPCWRLMRKVPLADSFGKTWKGQEQFIRAQESKEVIPSARQVVYLMVALAATQRERMCRETTVRTGSVDNLGNHVCVGNFDDRGLFIGGFVDGERVGSLGIASAVPRPSLES